MENRRGDLQKRPSKRPRHLSDTRFPARGGEGSSSSSSGGGGPPESNVKDATTTCVNSSVAADPTQWGLDPIYWSYARLLNFQIQKRIKSIPGIENSHILGSHPLSRVELVGTIVRVVDLEHMVKYTLDDTTGLVDCTHWKLRNKKAYNGEAGVVKGGDVQKSMTMTVTGDLVPSFTMLEGADAGDAASSSSSSAPAPMFAPVSKTFQLGDIVRVRGKLHKVPEHYLQRYLCFSEREVSLSSIAKVRHVHDALLHRLTAIKLSESFYEQTLDEPQAEGSQSAD